MNKLIETWLNKVQDDWKNKPHDYHQEMSSEEVCAPCQFPVEIDARVSPFFDGYGDCGEPSTRWVWWRSHDKGMYVCEKHFNRLEEIEEEEKAKVND